MKQSDSLAMLNKNSTASTQSKHVKTSSGKTTVDPSKWKTSSEISAKQFMKEDSQSKNRANKMKGNLSEDDEKVEKTISESNSPMGDFQKNDVRLRNGSEESIKNQ